MWINTNKGWRFFEVEYTKQGIPYPTKEIIGRNNFNTEKIKLNKIYGR